jgi:hypothetical protein
MPIIRAARAMITGDCVIFQGSDAAAFACVSYIVAELTKFNGTVGGGCPVPL